MLVNPIPRRSRRFSGTFRHLLTGTIYFISILRRTGCNAILDCERGGRVILLFFSPSHRTDDARRGKFGRTFSVSLEILMTWKIQSELARLEVHLGNFSDREGAGVMHSARGNCTCIHGVSRTNVGEWLVFVGVCV